MVNVYLLRALFLMVGMSALPYHVDSKLVTTDESVQDSMGKDFHLRSSMITKHHLRKADSAIKNKIKRFHLQGIHNSVDLTPKKSASFEQKLLKEFYWERVIFGPKGNRQDGTGGTCSVEKAEVLTTQASFLSAGAIVLDDNSIDDQEGFTDTQRIPYDILNDRVDEYCKKGNLADLTSMWLKDYVKYHKKFPTKGLNDVFNQLMNSLKNEVTSDTKEEVITILTDIKERLNKESKGNKMIKAIDGYMNKMKAGERFNNFVSEAISAGVDEALGEITESIISAVAETLSNPVSGMVGGISGLIAGKIVEMYYGKNDNRAKFRGFVVGESLSLIIGLSTIAITAASSGMAAPVAAGAGAVVVASIGVKEALKGVWRGLPGSKKVATIYNGLQKDVCAKSFSSGDPVHFKPYQKALLTSGNKKVSLGSGQGEKTGFQVNLWENACTYNPVENKKISIAHFSQVFPDDVLIVCPNHHKEDVDIIYARGGNNEYMPGTIARISSKELKKSHGDMAKAVQLRSDFVQKVQKEISPLFNSEAAQEEQPIIRKRSSAGKHRSGGAQTAQDKQPSVGKRHSGEAEAVPKKQHSVGKLPSGVAEATQKKQPSVEKYPLMEGPECNKSNGCFLFSLCMFMR